MNNTAKRTYSEAQENYMAAQALLEVEAKNEDHTSDAYCDALMLRLAAENALIEWSKQVIMSKPKLAARFGDVEAVFTRGIKMPSIRAKLIDAVMKMDAAA